MASKTSIEKYLEKKFVDWCRENKIIAVKGPAQMYKGIPDRIVIIPNGGTIWVEFKGNTYYQLSPMQQKWKSFLLASDPDRYFCINTKEELNALIQLCADLLDGFPIYTPSIFKNIS